MKTWELNKNIMIREIKGNSIIIDNGVSKIYIPIKNIEDLVEMLIQIRAYFAHRNLAQIEKDALARWGKEPTPCDS